MSSELYIQSLPGEYQIDLLDHCCAWRIAKEDVAGESKHALAKSILVQTSKCSREGFNVDIHRWFRSALPCCMRKEPRPCIFSMAKSLRGLPAAVCAWASVVDKQGCLCFSFFKKTK